MTEGGKPLRLSGISPSLKKAFIISLSAAIFAIIFGSFSDDGSNSAENHIVNNTNAVIAQDTPTISRDVAVTSQTVKHVDGKYRYFFDIRNNDTKPFEGSVTIELLMRSENALGRENFVTQQAIEPGLGSSVFLDINTGPVPIFDEDLGISSFRYEAKGTDGKTIKKGEGGISKIDAL